MSLGSPWMPLDYQWISINYPWISSDSPWISDGQSIDIKRWSMDIIDNPLIFMDNQWMPIDNPWKSIHNMDICGHPWISMVYPFCSHHPPPPPHGLQVQLLFAPFQSRRGRELSPVSVNDFQTFETEGPRAGAWSPMRLPDCL